MVKVSEKNGFQNVQETERELFQIGGPGGPGRGNSRKSREISEVVASIKSLSQDGGLNLMDSTVLDLIGRLILHDVASKDTKIRLDSIKQFLNLLTKRLEAAERDKRDDTLSNPETLERFSEIVRMRQDLDVMEAEDLTDLLCDDCKKKLGIDEGLKEND